MIYTSHTTATKCIYSYINTLFLQFVMLHKNQKCENSSVLKTFLWWKTYWLVRNADAGNVFPNLLKHMYTRSVTESMPGPFPK